ncbi:MAG: hypothetical protein EOP06_26290 [Proteobacteria bacterium]|nr:MAG: hypothetical protein EOP06_26290 [Pseudomonadota bacterium]
MISTNPTSFVKGRTYAVSFPYETSANATSRNVFDRTRNDASLTVDEAFNYAPMGINAAGQTVRLYSLSRFNPNTLTYEAIPDNGLLLRGEGYLLRVNDAPANGETLRLAMPADNPLLQALTVGNNLNVMRFTINLVYNASLAGNGLNGRNLIGFGFDPAKYNAVVWDTTSTGTVAGQNTSAQIMFNGQNYTVKDAVAAGLINGSLLDATTGRAVNSVNVYGGYFVTARRAGVVLRFQNPITNN